MSEPWIEPDWVVPDWIATTVPASTALLAGVGDHTYEASHVVPVHDEVVSADTHSTTGGLSTHQQLAGRASHSYGASL